MRSRAARARVRAGRTTAGTVASALLTASLAGLLLSACDSTPTAIGPTGVDGLVIPTPSPDPADFSSHVDNPWFPLTPGSTWTYRRFASTSTATLAATVLPGTTRVDGVPTTVVRWQRLVPGGRPVTLAVRWYAQDTAGNVWWFGQRVSGSPSVDRLAPHSWRAGRRGAQAGVVVTAHPRDGDGYANGWAPHVMERHSTVLTLDASVALPHGHYQHTVETQDHSPLVPVVTIDSFFARGVGLVAQQAVKSVATDLTLVHYQAG